MKIIPKLQNGSSLFVTYTPRSSQQEKTSTQASTTKSSSTNDSLEDEFTKLFKDLDGLPNEMHAELNNIMSILKLESLTGIDTGTLKNRYMAALYQISRIKDNKKKYDEALKKAYEADSLEDPVIDNSGKIFVMDSDNKIKKVSLDTLTKGNYQILTIEDLAHLRKNSSAFNHNDEAIRLIYDSMGYSKFQKQLQNANISLGSASITQTNKNALKGLQVLQNLSEDDKKETLQHIIDGSIKTQITNSDIQIQAYINYLKTVLPKKAKVWAALKTGITDENKATEYLILQYLMGRASSKLLTDDTVKGNKSSSKTTGIAGILGDSNMTMAQMFLAGYGNKSKFYLSPGTDNGFYVSSNSLPLTDKSGHPIGIDKTLDKVFEGQYGPILDINNISMGGVKIDSTQLSYLVLRDNNIFSIDLPIKRDPLSGAIQPMNDEETLTNKGNAENEISSLGIDLTNKESVKQNVGKINEIYQKYKLPVAYDSEGDLNQEWARFGVIHAIADSSAFDALESPSLKKIESETLLNKYRKITDPDDYVTDDDDQEMYEGTVWIPLLRNYHGASVGQTLTGDEALALDTASQAASARQEWTSGRKVNVNGN